MHQEERNVRDAEPVLLQCLANDLRHADDTLDASYDQAVATAIELIAFCRRVGVPFGLNVESVSIRRVEIEASVRLAARLRAELRR